METWLPVGTQVLMCMCMCLYAAPRSSLHPLLSNLPMCPFTQTPTTHEVNCLSYVRICYVLVNPPIYLVGDWVRFRSFAVSLQRSILVSCGPCLAPSGFLTVPAWPMATGRRKDENKASGQGPPCIRIASFPGAVGR